MAQRVLDPSRLLRNNFTLCYLYNDLTMQVIVNKIWLLVLLMLATCFIAQASAGTLNPLYTFPGVTEGKHPNTTMVYTSGLLYGVTNQGGNYGMGAIYSVDPTTNTTTTLYSFQGGRPSSSLVVDNGVLLGAVNNGTNNGGSLFQFDLIHGTETVIYTASPSSSGTITSVAIVNGILYGTTSGNGGTNVGTIFAYDITAGNFTAEFAFNPASSCGGFPSSPLLLVGNLLYGTLGASSGSLYAFNPATRKIKCLHSFSPNTANQPVGNLVYTDGKLFGTLYTGGEGSGGVFEANPDTGATAIIYNFTGTGLDGRYPPAGLTLHNGKLYGITQGWTNPGAVYSIDPATGAEETLANFSSYAVFGDPAGGLTEVGGLLYGTTYGVINNDPLTDGTVFAFNPASAQISLVHQFRSPASRSNSALHAVGGVLYGTSSDGGTADQGAIVALNTSSGSASAVSSFMGGVDGAVPLADLTAFGNKLCGTTSSGGTGAWGTIFCFAPASKVRTKLYDFTDGLDGGSPSSALLALQGLLYGVTTAGGGQMNNGTVFAFNPASLAFQTLYDFTNADAYGSDLGFGSALAFQANKLVGVRQGNAYSVGVAYSVNLVGGGAPIYQFRNAPGPSYPDGKLVVTNNALYGTSSAGGTGTKAGTIYTLNVNTGLVEIVYSFSGASDGSAPSSTLLSLNGMLYGTTKLGGSLNNGTLFVFDPATRSETTLYSFTGGADGAFPRASLIQVGGVLYGTTDYGGVNNRGVIFAFKP